MNTIPNIITKVTASNVPITIPAMAPPDRLASSAVKQQIFSINKPEQTLI